jgi:hypothetical protein
MAEIRIQNTGVDRGSLGTRVADLSARLAKTAIFGIFTHASRTYADGDESRLLHQVACYFRAFKALIVD